MMPGNMFSFSGHLQNFVPSLRTLQGLLTKPPITLLLKTSSFVGHYVPVHLVKNRPVELVCLKA